MRASAFCWRAACQRLGGNPPTPAFPRRGKRERGRSDFLAAAGIRARSTTTLLSIMITNLYVDPLVPAFPKSCWCHPTPLPCFYPHSHGPHWARCMLGSDLKPRSITSVTDLGCWVLPSLRRSLLRISGVNAVTRTRRWMSLLTKLLEAGLRAFNSCWLYVPSSGFLNAVAGNGSGLVAASCPWPATLLPLSARHGVAAHTLLR
jgi:hypothetical protein